VVVQHTCRLIRIVDQIDECEEITALYEARRLGLRQHGNESCARRCALAVAAADERAK